MDRPQLPEKIVIYVKELLHDRATNRSPVPVKLYHSPGYKGALSSMQPVKTVPSSVVANDGSVFSNMPSGNGSAPLHTSFFKGAEMNDTSTVS